jgi:hypothetical protein
LLRVTLRRPSSDQASGAEEEYKMVDNGEWGWREIGFISR